MAPIIEREYIPRSTDTFWMEKVRAHKQDIRPLKVAILNLMPNKLETEEQLFRVLSNSPLQIEVDLIRTETYQSKNTSQEILKQRYRYFSELDGEKFDAFIITGSPIERMEFEEVAYWEELTKIFDYVRENVYSTLFLCWSAQAALYYYYGIEKKRVPEKIFGIEEFEVLHKGPLVQGFDTYFRAPQSRYTFVPQEAVQVVDNLILYAGSERSGAQLVASEDHRFVFMAGHLEYDIDTLDKEYRRDEKKGLHTAVPFDYYEDDDPKGRILGGWSMAANLFYSNWLNYCVYQQTPYEIERIQKKIVAKFGGTSLSHGLQFEKVRKIVEEHKHAVIVASAPGKREKDDKKVTDVLIDYSNNQLELYALEKRVEELKKLKEKNLAVLRARFEEIKEALQLSGTCQKEIDHVLRDLELSNDRSFIISRGEHLNAKLLSHFLDYSFIDATELIFFDPSGNLDRKKTEKMIQKRLGNARGVVVPGFYGINENGEIVLFDRGGSDITGSLIASALRLQVYENWTDVNGVYSEDPTENPNAKKFPEMTYDELLAITKNGATVYHPEAIQPLMDAKVLLKIKNTNAPEQEGTQVNM